MPAPLKKRSARKSRPSPKPPAVLAKSSLGPVSADQITLVRTAGTKTRGGGKGGEAWVIQVEDKRAGTVFINVIEDGQRGKHASVQIFLNRTNQGRQIGRVAYQAACLASQYDEIYAHMRKSNTASKKAALYAGFEDATTNGDSQLVMRWCRVKASNALGQKTSALKAEQLTNGDPAASG